MRNKLHNMNEAKKKKRTWLWVLGWIFLFPLPLTILLMRKQTMKPGIKYGIIAAAWILFSIIGLSEEGKNAEEGTYVTSTETAEEVENKVEEKENQEVENKVEEKENQETESKVEKELDEVTEKEENVTESVQEDTENKENIYSKLSDKEFAELTNILAKSFYSLAVSDSEYEMLMNEPNIMECLTKALMYGGNNYYVMDPEYVDVFSERYEILSNIDNYDLLQENFKMGYMMNMETGEWAYAIEAYSIDEKDVVEFDGVQYIDPEGYLQPGVTIYWIEDDKMCEIGEIVDIAYNKEVDGTCYPYALNVEFYDDPYSSGWRDGYSFLRTNKELCGEPAYYIQVIDPSRRIQKEEIDFSGDFRWIPLNVVPVGELIGTEVYWGRNSAKTYMFKIIDADKSSDKLLVEYPGGNVELKSYRAIINDASAFARVI